MTKRTISFDRERRNMVARQIKARGVTSKAVLDAMSTVPRHLFVPIEEQGLAYTDQAPPIGDGQTISQPYIVAIMTELVGATAGAKILDVGTGSGYQAAVLDAIGTDVYSIEIVESHFRQASERLKALGFENVQLRHGYRYEGWPEEAPFDGIVLAAAPARVPPALIEQLKPGGRMVLPVGVDYQKLLVVSKDDEGNVTERAVMSVAFVPMTGAAEEF